MLMLIAIISASVCRAADDDANAAVQHIRPGKIRGANLPQEYELTRLTCEIANPPSSWNTSTKASDWMGVSCDENSRVTRINWSYMDLIGTLQWDYLCSTLQEFQVWQNGFSGNVPLNKLPAEMTKLEISCNAFSGELDFSHLPEKMDTIILTQNNFEGCVDLTRLPEALTFFNINENNFSRSVCLSNLPSNLRLLGLARNHFTGPLDLQHLPPSLQVFEGHGNLFSGIVLLDCLPEGLRKLTLEENTKLVGEIDKDVIPTSLRHIRVDGTQISTNIE